MCKTTDEYYKAAIECVEKLKTAAMAQVADRYKGRYIRKKGRKKGEYVGAGVYAIYEKDKPMYVGRTSNVAQRLSNHYTGGNRSAPLAKRLTEGNKTDPNYNCKLKESKNKVKEMQVRFVEIDCAITQALAEILAYIEIKPKHGDFENY